MDWRIKAAVQGLASILPASERWNSLLQRATGSYAVSPAKVPASVHYARRHLTNVSTWAARPAEDCRFFEFGAGWALQGPIAMSLLGAGRQIVFDLHRHVRSDFVETVLDAHRRFPPDDAVRTIPRNGNDPMAVVRAMHIDYQAPADARRTGLDTSSIDVVTSTNTLEHIPVADIETIFEEMRRILASDGLISFQIDYKDHYSYADPSISPYHFLQHGPHFWRLVNNDLQFQNRLRHTDYLDLLDRHGFDVISADVVEPSHEDLAVLRTLDIDREFAEIDLAELGRREAFIVARPRA